IPPSAGPPPLLLNPVLEHQGAYPLLRLDERRRELESMGAETFDFGTGDPREPTDGFIRRALQEGVPETLPAPPPRRAPQGAGKHGRRDLRFWHRRPPRTDRRVHPPRPAGGRPRDQPLPRDDRQEGAAGGLRGLDGPPPRRGARAREDRKSGV